MSVPTGPSSPVDWPDGVHRAFSAAGVTQVGYVPDAGHKRLIELCHADAAMCAVPLTSEEEGVGLAAGAWLGGAKVVLLMQSSGVGNVVNALAMARECRFPVVMLVTMRGEEGETNPWQAPMGQAAATVLEAMGVEVRRVEVAEGVVPAVESAAYRAYDVDNGGGTAVAVLIAQKVIGVKAFVEGAK
jgi:sulfopyruvate decarboxylase alpha subunit